MNAKSSQLGFLKKLSSQGEFIGLLPITGWQIFFYLVPFGFLIVISFWMTKDYQIISTWNWGNYKAVFTDPLVRIAFFRSLGITLTTLVITILAAYPFAYGLVFKVPKKYRHVILIAIIAPFWTNYLVRVYSWQLIIGGTGLINHLLSLSGIIDSPLNILYTHIATRIGLLHFLISVMILNLYGTLDNVNKSYIEAASDLGASPFKSFLWVTFPLSLPGLANGTVFVFIFSFTDFIAPSVLGGGTKPVYSQMVVDAAHWTANYPYASALSIVMLLVIAIFLLIIFMSIRAIAKK